MYVFHDEKYIVILIFESKNSGENNISKTCRETTKYLNVLFEIKATIIFCGLFSLTSVALGCARIKSTEKSQFYGHILTECQTLSNVRVFKGIYEF